MLFNFFSDPALRTRQDQLDAQWNAAWAAWQMCDNTPDSLFSQFSTDRTNWKIFYDSGSDWDSDSNNATNSWQAKLKSWTDQMTSWGCTGNGTLTEGTVGSDAAPLPNGIPGIKAPPPDTTSILSQAKDAIGNAGQGLWSDITTIGWVILFVVVGLIAGVIYLLLHTKVSSPQYGSIAPT